MSPDQERSLEEIFSAARDLPPLERTAYLERVCGDDTELHRQADSLLAAHEQAGPFLQPTGNLSTASAPFEKSGDRIGRYKLLEQVGEGGFGVVWMAEQEEPVRRRVALKIIKLGMDTKEVVARFEAERQALAMMDNPNIASVFDGGATDTGRPYFVMELVKGVPITDYCDANKLSTHERLELFMQVCQAVQHAHQKGIIHRDLKPSNILVTVKDDRPVPKVIDFGVAKATQARLTEKTMFTQFRQWIGTPAYMSPEQAGLGSLDVDTRSDVYSLVVLLYELLTGRTPFDTQTLLEKGHEAVMRTIREEEPPKPSTRLSTLAAEELNAVAAKRGAEPARLNRLVRGDLDWIVMKALEKDRRRRYETANALALDLEHHLGNEPVSAVAPSALYTLQKLMHRHKASLTTAAALVLLLAAGAAVSTWQAVRATHAERAAEGHAARATAEAIRSMQTARFLKQMLGSVPAAIAPAHDTRLLRESLDRTAERVASEWKDQPALEAELQGGIAQVYFALGDYAKAEAVDRHVLTTFRELRGDEDEDVVAALDNLAAVLRAQNKQAEATSVQRESLAARRKLLGPDRPELIGPLHDLGWMLYFQRRYRDAEVVFREGVALTKSRLGEGDRTSIDMLNSLGCSLREQGAMAEAEAVFRDQLRCARNLVPRDDSLVSGTLGSLTLNMLYAKKFAEAEPIAREMLAIHEKLDPNDWFEFSNQSVLGACLLGQKKYAEAEPILVSGYQGMKQRYDDFPKHYKSRDLKLALNHLIQLYEETNQPAKAAEWKQELADFEKRENGASKGSGAVP